MAGCTEKANEVDDSSGALGSCVVALIQGRATARRATGGRTDRTASRLLSGVDDDPFGSVTVWSMTSRRGLTSPAGRR